MMINQINKMLAGIKVRYIYIESERKRKRLYTKRKRRGIRRFD